VTQRLALALLAIAAVAWAGGGQAATPAKRKPPPVVRIVEPGALALDYIGGLVVADRKLNRVVRIDPRTGKRRVVASGLRDIVALTYDDMLRLYVGAAERIYRISFGRKVLVAGNGRRAHTGDGGPATTASLSGLSGFEVDHDETITIAEYDNWIRFVDENGTISTIAGTGEEGYAGDGGPARSALLRHPHDLALRVDREVIVADSHNHVLRRIDPAGNFSTFAAGFGAPVAVKGGPGNTVYVADAQANAVYRLDPEGGSRTQVVRASGPFNLAVGYSNIYVTELAGARRVLQVSGRGRIRVLVR
jgi:DNA-binding beta-propeller fold protein YncE